MHIVTTPHVSLSAKFNANTYIVSRIMPEQKLMQLNPVSPESTILGGDAWMTALMPSVKIGTIITL